MINFEQIQLDFRAKIPLYVQLSGQIRLQMEQGALRADEQLPPVRGLAERLRVNFNTVARAYRLLDIEGWISTQQGRGTYVTTQSWPKNIAAQMLLEETEAAAELTTPDEASEATAHSPLPHEAGSAQESALSLNTASQDQSARQAALTQLIAQAAELGITLSEIQTYMQAEQTAGASQTGTARQHLSRHSHQKGSRLRKPATFLSSIALDDSAPGKRPALVGRKKRNPVT
jgi:DNA-binding transcriptional regulator YhcF (GntR family)